MTPTRVARSQAIDLIKGLAIVSVICMHTFSASFLREIGSRFHVSQAVPVFVCLMGLNAASSLRRRGGRTLRELYSWEYLAGRFDRIYVPFAIAFFASLALAVATNTPHSSGAKLLGQLMVGLFPIDGPGNYFVTLLFEFVLMFPLIFWGLLRWPLRTLLVCLAINFAFEEFAPRLGFFEAYPYAEISCLLGYLFLVALGGVLAEIPAARALRSRWLRGGVLLSVVLLVLVEVYPAAFVPVGTEQSAGLVLSAFYPACMILLGIAFLPSEAKGPIARVGAVIGRASYHIFLVQLVWFGLVAWSARPLLALAGNLAVTLVLGVAFYELLARAHLPTASGLLAGYRGKRGRRAESPAQA